MADCLAAQATLLRAAEGDRYARPTLVSLGEW